MSVYKRFGFSLFLAGAFAAAGCSGGGSPSSVSSSAGGMNPAATRIGMLDGQLHRSHAVMDAPIHPDHRKSWISPDIKKYQALLFESDYSTGDVYILLLPTMALKATLTGFSAPQDLCSDRQGNVWIPATGGNAIYKYSHAGALLATLSDPGGPDGCAVDPTTGNLAVVNEFGPSGSPGELLVYKNATGTPTTYSTQSMYQYWYAAYDNSGNLFIDGCNTPNYCENGFALAKLPVGSTTTLTPITLTGGSIVFTGTIQWDNVDKNLAIGDQLCGGTHANCIYHAVPAETSANTWTITGNPTVLLNSNGQPTCDVVQPVLGRYQSRNFVAGADDNFCGSAPTSMYRWSYPAGGTPTNFGTNQQYSEPEGSAISNKG